MSSRASIVIPAHNEERRIRHLLQSLSDPSIVGLYDVYVVCNGCTDKTRQVAEEYAGITVVEIDGVGKHHALNQGDLLAGDVFPRLYCDADIQVSPSSIEALIEALTTEEIQVAGPAVHYGVQHSTAASWPLGGSNIWWDEDSTVLVARRASVSLPFPTCSPTTCFSTRSSSGLRR